ATAPDQRHRPDGHPRGQCDDRGVSRAGVSVTAASSPAMLEGIRVLDLSRVIAGPYCAMLLGDLGADVIKVERPGRGDDLREWRARTGRGGMSAVFAALNRNKPGVAPELQQAEGARVLRGLAARADVLIENFVPGIADRLEVGYDAVSALNP